MTRWGRILVTFVALFWALGAVAADFNETHVFNPTWPPHARFHAVFLLVVLLATTTVALGMTWSGNRLGAVLIAVYPAAFFVVPIVPGVAFSDPGLPAHDIAGIPGQLVMSGITFGLLGIAWILTRPRGH